MERVAVRSGSRVPRLRRLVVTIVLAATPLVASACSSNTGPGGNGSVTTTTQIPGY
jgi:hypothetical protein